MKGFLQQSNTGIFGRSFAEKTDQPKSSRSFDKVIFKDMPIQNSYSFWGRSNKSSKDKIKLFRFRKGAPTQDQCTLFRTPQSKKSLKSVRNITLTAPSRKSYFVKVGVDHLRLFLGRIARCPTIRLDLRADGNLQSPEAKFSKLWSGIFKELRKYDPKNLKINIQACWSHFYRANSEDLSWKRSTFRLLEFMKNVNFLHLNVTIIGRKAQFGDDQSRVCYYATRMKHLAKLKEIEIAGMENIIDDSGAAYKCALAPPALERVIIKINSSELSQPITESLNKLKNLKYFAFQGDLGIPEFLSVIQTHPGLTIVNAFHLWSHNNQNIPIDTLTQGLQLHNVTHLYLDVYLPIRSKEQCTFYQKLMGSFANLESLRIGFDTIKKMDFAGEYADILTPLKKITHLELGLSLTLENMVKFFTQMQPLTTLKHLIFAANIQMPKAVAKHFPHSMEPLKKFLLSLKSLEVLEMHCHKLGINFLQGICEMLLELQKLQSITFSFETNSDKYIPLHDTMIKEIQNTMEAITTTQEFYVTMINSWSWRYQAPKELVESMNENLKKFKFSVGDRYAVPQYARRWV